jgi:hypothetical protein
MRTGNRPAVRRKARNKLAAAAATCALLATAGMAYEGQAFGARVLNLDFPRTGMSIVLAVNSSTDNDDLSDLSSSVYQTLQHAGAIPGS